MDLLSSDIIINIILPFLPKCAQIALLHTSKRYHQLVLNSFPKDSRNHLEILREICKGGFVNLLRWFLGRGKSDLRWSLLVHGVKELLMDGNIILFSIFIFYFYFLF